MNIFKRMNKIVQQGLNPVFGKASMARQMVRKPVSPLADRILADALQLAEIPSPSRMEEGRATFILERLSSLNIRPQVDEAGTIQVHLYSATPGEEAPLLLFTYLGSKHWHSIESLSKVDDTIAAGACLADALGAASLLSCIEGISSGRFSPGRDLILFFLAQSIDEPEQEVFNGLILEMGEKPMAAIGLKGLSLGLVNTQSYGSYRMRIQISREQEESVEPAGLNQVVDSVITLARNLGSITWDSEHNTRCYIRRIEAGTGFENEPQEGLIDLELASQDDNLLNMAMKAVSATAANQKGDNLNTEINTLSFMPVGDISINSDLISFVLNQMKEQHIKITQESGSDPSAFLTKLGIPSLFLGLAQGRSGLNIDRLNIDSIEKGRLLLEAIIEGSNKFAPKGGSDEKQ